MPVAEETWRVQLVSCKSPMSVTRLYRLLFVVAIAGCAQDARLCANGVRSVIASEDIRESLLGKLADEGIQFQLGDDGAVCYSANDESIVDFYIMEIASSAVPPRTRLQIPGRNFTIAVMSALESAGIEFRSSENNGEIVVTLVQEEDVDVAYAIVRRIGEEQFNIQSR